jgi:hypothetical protein
VLGGGVATLGLGPANGVDCGKGGVALGCDCGDALGCVVVAGCDDGFAVGAG